MYSSGYNEAKLKHWNKPDPFKNKSPEQIINEFKAYTLPKLRN